MEPSVSTLGDSLVLFMPHYSAFAASMEPSVSTLGDLGSTRGIPGWVSRLQWSRAFQRSETHPMESGGMPFLRFNGAERFNARRRQAALQKTPVLCRLQWSRAFQRSETKPHPRMSQPPSIQLQWSRAFQRSETTNLANRLANSRSFNGAERFNARRPTIISTRSGCAMTSLQWSRAFQRSETARRDRAAAR